MEKLSNKDLLIVDDAVCDLLVHDIQVDRAQVQGRTGKELGRPQLFVSVDPYSGLIIACELNYEEVR